MRNWRFPNKSIPLAILSVTILSYGLMLPWTGFYWDDWPFAWIQKYLGSAEFFPAFEPFRPFLGPIFWGTTSLIPPIPLVWQFLALILRFALTLSIWWLYKFIWPKAKWQVLIATMLFLVFPGYSQHWVAYTHINQEWIPLLFYVLSFGFCAKAFRSPGKSKMFTGLAMVFMVCGIFPSEYFATQEPLRFLFLWVLVSEETVYFWSRLRTVFKLWWPYLIVWLGNAVWLVFYYRFGAYASYNVSVSGQFSIQEFSLAMADALWKAGIYSWGQVLILITRTISNPSTLLTLAVITLSVIILTFYLYKLDLPSFEAESKWGWQAVVCGVIGIVIGRIPSYMAGLPLSLQSINDRFMVSMMIGGSLFLAGLLELLLGKRHLKLSIFALIVALGIGQQFYTANNFRRDWIRQKEILWQMVWRIPGLETGTAVLTHELPLLYETDMGITAPLNWIYAPEYSSGNLPYALLYTRTRIGRATLPALDADQPISLNYRTVKFKGSTSQVVTILVPPNSCLQVLDSKYSGGDTYERQPHLLQNAIPLSDPSLILTDQQQPEMPGYLFGKEPPHTWCYYYSKAELARQVGDWHHVTQLGNEARQQGFAPGNALEWLPFIEGYLITGDYQTAREISILAYEDDSRPRKGLCHTWKRIRAQENKIGPVEQLASEMLDTFECAP